MAIQSRRGNQADFQPGKLLPGEFAVSVDTSYIYMCFSSGKVKRIALTEDLTNAISSLSDTLSGRITAVEDNGTTFTATLQALTNRVGATEASIQVDSSRLETVEGQTAANTRLLSDTVGRVDTLEPKVTALERTAAENGDRLTAVQETANSNQNAVGVLRGGLSTAQQDIAGLKSSVTNHQQNLDLLNTKTATQAQLERLIEDNQTLLQAAVTRAEAARDVAEEKADDAADSAETASTAIANIQEETQEGIRALNAREQAIDEALDAKKADILGYLDTTKEGYEEQFEEKLGNAQELFDTAVEESKTQALRDIDTAKVETVDSVVQTGQRYLDAMKQKHDAFVEGAQDKQDTLEDTWERARQQIIAKQELIQRITTTAETTAASALQNSVITLAELEELRGYVDEVKDTQEGYDARFLALAADMEIVNGEGWFLNELGERIAGPFTGMGGGGGGGGGGETTNARFTARNTSGWASKSVPIDGLIDIAGYWESVEEEIPTGDGSLTVYINNILYASKTVPQGAIALTINTTGRFNVGTNIVEWTIEDIYGNKKRFRQTVTIVELKVESTFDVSLPFSGPITFPYTPYGNIEKTIHFILDGEEFDSFTTKISNRQLSIVIPEQTYGSHTLRVYSDAVIAGESVRSADLYYEFVQINQYGEETIITSSFDVTEVNQYANVVIPFRVYDPSATTAEARIYANGTLVSTQTVDRSEHTYAYAAKTSGEVTIRIEADRATPKVFTLTVNKADVEIEPESEGLAMSLYPDGRSNNEAPEQRQTWTNGGIAAQLTGFRWRKDGWQTDSNGVDILRLESDARCYIPFKPLEDDPKTAGLTIELDFSTRAVTDYNAVIISCMDNNVGFSVTSQRITFRGNQTPLETYIKDGTQVHFTMVVESQGLNRFIYFFINGALCAVDQYPSGERFTQLSPVGITIGSNDCGVDIYGLRAYKTNFNFQQVLNNWIADIRDGAEKLAAYERNDIYDANGSIAPATVKGKISYIIYKGAELPPSKGQKRTVDVELYDVNYPSLCFTAEGVEIDRQGTSSAPYFRANYDLKFKNGFNLPSGHTTSYSIYPTSYPFNRFVVKADVASSESVNNVGGAMIYNEVCPYKVPEMLQDSRIRWGIEGKPLLAFFYNTETGVTEFLGKGNFNLPKRADGPLGYKGTNDLSIEVERNNSANVKFQAADYEGTEWYDDFEFRFPSDEYRDTNAITEAFGWIASTWRGGCTNQALESPVTYTYNDVSFLDLYPDDETYTVTTSGETKSVVFRSDTPAYRLGKFRAEADQYIELDSALCYYEYFLTLLGIDSFAKNMFVAFHGGPAVGFNYFTRKIVLEVYDLDTIMGTNNTGKLYFGYHLLDTDHVDSIISGDDSGASDAPVFNAQDSALFCNLRDGFPAERRAMYITMRNSGKFSAPYILNYFENYQKAWSEAMLNEDHYTKYLYPAIYPVTYDESTKTYIRTKFYLPMALGFKTMQRRWWLTNRFRVTDSMDYTGDAMANVITMRVFNSGTMRLKAAMTLFIGVQFGGGSKPILIRTTAGEWAAFTYTSAAGVNEMETWIHSADQITYIEGLPGLYVNEADFSKAVRLRRLELGSLTEGYKNNNLRDFDIQNCSLLEYLNVANCPNLAITVFAENCDRLEEAYFDGTSITGFDPQEGGPLRVLHLPGTITAFTAIDLQDLEDLTVDSYANVTRLMAANLPEEVFDIDDVLSQLPDQALVYLGGLEYTANTAQDIDEIYDNFDRFKGVTREKSASGEWMYHEFDKAQVNGVVHIDSIRGDESAALLARYPYIRIDAKHTECTLTYKTYDGSSVLYTETIYDGGNGTKTNSTARESTMQYNYTPNGWALTANGSANADALKGITADRTVYAAYTATTRSHTITFATASADGGKTLQSSSVPYGTKPSYTGATPTTTKGDAADYPFIGWEPTIRACDGPLTYYAKFDSPVEVVEKTDSWATVIAAVKNGTYKTNYKKGNIFGLDLGDEGQVGAQIINFDPDGVPGIEFMTYKTLPNKIKFSGHSDKYEESTLKSKIESCLTLLPQNVQGALVSATKNYVSGNVTSKIYAPTLADVTTGMFADSSLRIRNNVSSGAASTYYTGSKHPTMSPSIAYVSANGSTGYSDNTINTTYGVVFCFRISTYEYAHMRSDVTLQQVIDARDGGTLSDLLSPGDIIPLDLGTEGTVNLQLMGFGLDDKADGSGKAAASFVAYHAVNTSHRWNPSRSGSSGNYTEGTGTIGGYPKSELKTFLENDIWSKLPTILQNAAVEVTKGCPSYNSAGNSVTINYNCKIWVPSYTEVFSNTSATHQPSYTAVLSSADRRKKTKPGSASAVWWWLRSAYSNISAYGVYSSGLSSGIVNCTSAVVFGLSI